MKSIISLASDNFSGIHPEVLSAIEKANRGHSMAYGDDPWTQRAQELFKHHFGPSCEAFIVFNGTGANVCGLRHVLSTWQAAFCTNTAHIWTDECGALQAVGCSLIPVPAKEGKLDLKTLQPFIEYQGNLHHIQPAAISITQSTEMGTLYSLDEMKKIAQFARKHNLLFHVDGARISNAAAALKVPLKTLSTDVGVDILSYGGTKNGLMGADAILFLRPGLSKNFQYVWKQHSQLASKMRFLSAQLVALLEGDLWLKNASHSNAMAKLLEEKLRREVPQTKILFPVEANSVFVQMPATVLKKMQEKTFFWIWSEETSTARFMTTWDTNPELIQQFVSDLKKSF